MKKFNFWILLRLTVLIGLLSSCATTPPAEFVPMDVPPGRAVIYFYRLPDLKGAAVFYDITLGDTETVIGRLGNGVYFPYVVDPGTYVFRARTEKAAVAALDVVADKIYYIRGTIESGVWVGRPRLEVVHELVGKEEIARCRPAEKE